MPRDLSSKPYKTAIWFFLGIILSVYFLLSWEKLMFNLVRLSNFDSQW